MLYSVKAMINTGPQLNINPNSARKAGFVRCVPSI